MKLLKYIFTIFFVLAMLTSAIFLTGRYGWKLFGFSACESAGIEQINVEEDHVRIRGFYPGSFPQGFLGYHAEQVDSILYVGFKFSGLFGIFESGDFDITIPTKGTVTQVVVKSGEYEYTAFRDEELFVSETEATENGIYVCLERSEVYSVDRMMHKEIEPDKILMVNTEVCTNAMEVFSDERNADVADWVVVDQ